MVRRAREKGQLGRELWLIGAEVLLFPPLHEMDAVAVDLKGMTKMPSGETVSTFRTVESSYILAMSCGMLSSVLGASVIFGWHTGNVTLIQVSQLFVPMQYNTALGFLISGLGLLFATRGIPSGGQACGAVAMLIGLLTLSEYALGLDLGIDQLLMEHYITVETSHPGRMAPNTAMCFLLLGAALSVSGAMTNSSRRTMTIGLLGSLIVGLSTVALSGYAINVETAYGWGQLTRMAVHTATGFIILGIGAGTLSWYTGRNSLSRLPDWFPASAGLGVLVYTICLWQAFHARETGPSGQGAAGFVEEAMLLFGIALAGALSLAIHLAQNARRRSDELATEIIERKEAERQRMRLEASEERFALALRGTKDGLYDWNYETDEVFYSPSWFGMLGYEPGEFEGNLETWSKLVHPDDLSRTLELVDTCVNGEADSYSLEFRMKHRDGHWVPILSRAYAGRDAETHKVTRFVGIHTDLTERHAAEAKLRKALAELTEAKNAADEANRAKSRFLANMSHEIRSPMNAILGFSDLILRNRKLDTSDRTNLEIVKRSGVHLLALINDVLDMSKIEAGRVQILNEDFDPHGMFEDVHLMFRMQMAEKALAFTVTVDESVPDALYGDMRRIRQILINLIGNALKFTESGGIYVTAEATLEGDEGVRLTCTIQDTGSGIAPEDQERIFEAFEQTDTGVRQGGGTGLGLPLSRSSAGEMGVDITVTSGLGEGSTFTLTLALERATGVAPMSVPDTREILRLRPESGAPRILVADDVEENHLYLAAVLGGAGFDVRVSVNGKQAVAEARDWSPALIVMDAVMPVMDGREAIARLGQMSETAGIPIIAISASVQEDEIGTLLDAGAHAFIAKPISRQDLLVAISQHIEVDYDYREEIPSDGSADDTVEEMTARAASDILPADLIARLQAAAKALSISDIEPLLEEVDTHDPPLGKTLRNLMDVFNWEEVSRILET